MREFDDRLSTNKRLVAYRENEEKHLIEALAKQYDLPYLDLRGVAINPEAIQVVDEAEAREAKLVAFERKRDTLSVALRNPNNPRTKAVLKTLRETFTLNLFLTSQKSLAHAWTRYEDQSETTATKRGVLNIDPEEIETLRSKLTTRKKVAAHVGGIKTVNNARRITQTLDALFAGALALHASDIHIEPEESGVRLRYRLDGVLHDVHDLDRAIYERLVSRIKLLAGLILNVRDTAQDGRFTFALPEKAIEVRTSVIPGAAGESVVMRLLDPTVASFNMDQLGLNRRLYEVMKEELTRPNGMIITTGPTGSGKTTALYAFLREAHTPEVKIVTIEDPVEYKVDDIVQTQVEDDYTFASGLRAILRQDPDIIMVGEIRDREVAETAIQAAQTGHLVFSTLHTNDAVGAFPRLIDLGVRDRLIGSAVNIVLGQRLVRVLCDACKTPYEPTESERITIKEIYAQHPDPEVTIDDATFYTSCGCAACSNTGFTGRRGVFEAIRVDTAVEDAAIRDPRAHIIRKAALPQGIPTMAQDGIEKVLKGITSLTELQRVVDLKTETETAHQVAEESESDTDDMVAHHTI